MSDHTKPWSNITPAETGKVGVGNDDIQSLKTDVSERMEIDHIFDNSVSDGAGQDGVHRKLTMKNDVTVSSGIVGAGVLHIKDVSGKAELHYMDEDDNDVQITSAGALNVELPFTMATGVATVPIENGNFGIAYPSGFTYNNTLAKGANVSSDNVNWIKTIAFVSPSGLGVGAGFYGYYIRIAIYRFA